MNLSEIKQSIDEAEELIELSDIELSLLEYIGELHKSLILSQDVVEKSEYKCELSLSYALVELCKERKIIIKDTNARFNHNFRRIAQIILDKQKYKYIKELAHLPLKQVLSQIKISK